MTIKLRYKKPEGDVSRLIIRTVLDTNIILSRTSEDFRWSAAVALFGMRLRDSEFAREFSYENIIQLAEAAKGDDKNGYRSEFISLIKSMGLLASR